MLLTAAVFLFAFGLVIQYRLFSDPEYGADGASRAVARKSKTQAARLLNIRTGYDDEKKKFMFGDPASVPESLSTQPESDDRFTLGSAVTSVNTYIPIAALFALALGFRAFKSDRVLLWLQRHALLIGIATLVPFALIVLLFSEEGKFLGQTTPWEGVKLLFLVSFAGMLADTYRHLGRTRWGLPPARYLLPFGAIAAMPVVPFFALSDFGRALVFSVYAMLYVVAVRQKAQLVYAFECSLASSAQTGVECRAGCTSDSINGPTPGFLASRYVVVEDRLSAI